DGPGGGCPPPRGRQAAGGGGVREGLLLPAHRARRLQDQDAVRPGGVVRPGADRGDLLRCGPGRGGGRGGRPGQRHVIRAGRCGVDRRRWPRGAGRGAAAPRDDLDQRLPPVRAAGGVGRLQAERHRPGAGPGGPGRVPRDQAHLAQHPAEAAGLVRLPTRRWAVKRYDIVIVGGGWAGCALANRPSPDPETTVLVHEAGQSDFRTDPFVHMPAALPSPIGRRFYAWQYESEPEPYMTGRRVYPARGKVLGGSSSINGMIFQRGNPLDYERWAAEPGMENWGYRHCLPYFKRMETLILEDGTPGADAWRGGSGPLVVERGPARTPLFGAFFEAVQQAGYPLTDDVNGYRQEGFAKFDR